MSDGNLELLDTRAMVALHDEWVFELERPARTDRRGGKKNDPLDAALGTRGASQDPISASPIDR